MHWILHCLTWNLHIKKVAANWKQATYGTGILPTQGIPCHLEEGCAFSKGMVHPLEESSIVCRSIACWKTLHFLKGNCKLMNVSLQAGDTSLLHLRLQFRTGVHYAELKLHKIYIYIHVRKRLLQGKAALLEGHPASFSVIFCKEQWKGSWNYVKDIKVQICLIKYCQPWIVSTYIYDPLPCGSDVIS